MSRLLLVVFISALSLTALLLLVLIVGGERLGSDMGRVLGVSTATAMAAVMALAAGATLRAPAIRPAGIATLILTAAAYVLMVSYIVGASDRRDPQRLTWTFVVLAGGMAMACSILTVRLLDQWRLVRGATLLALAGVCLGTVAEILRLDLPGMTDGRFIAVAAVLFGVGIALVLVGREQTRKALIKEEGGVTVPRCPHCGEELPRDLAEVFH